MLERYQAEGCQYSARVRQAPTDPGVSYVAHNPRSTAGEVRNRGTYDELGVATSVLADRASRVGAVSSHRS